MRNPAVRESPVRAHPWLKSSFFLVAIRFALALGTLLPSCALAGPAEPDARTVPWTTLRRLALVAGRSLPPIRPLSGDEILQLLAEPRTGAAGAPADPDESAVLAELRAEYGGARGTMTGLRLRFAHHDLGDVVPGEAGLAMPSGLAATAEPSLVAQRGRAWLAVAPRLRGRLVAGGLSRVAPPLRYEGWPVATWGPARGVAREDDGPWRVDWPLAAAGVRLGGWSLAAGRFPARTGPGEGGGLLLDTTAPAFPSLVVRRVAPFAWRGPLRRLAPSALLLRAGRLSAREMTFGEGWSTPRVRRDEPWFLQWLVAWEPARWLTAGASLSAAALPRDGTLWPDLLQVALPLLSATGNEVERGPVTDRVFGVTLEARWRRAPWRLLPASAGRVYWEYAGEDFNPPGFVPLLPQVSAPASVLGAELVGPRWDLAVEYAELEHPLVLWYAHESFGDGYAHDGWPLGHPLGGGGESLAAEVRWRPRGSGRELALRGGRSTAGRRGVTPGGAERWSWEASVRPAAGLGPWRAWAAWTRERVTPFAGPAARADWWRFGVELRP